MKKSNKTQVAQAVETIQTFKGFNQDLTCRDYQFEIGKTYEHEGDVEACAGGFHACEYPLDVFNYYPPATSRYCRVEQSGDLSRHDDDSKVASRTITVKTEIDLFTMISAAIEWTTSRCNPVDPDSPASSTGTQGAASSTGTRGAASSTGYQGAASNSGEYGIAAAFGIEGKAKSSLTGAIVLVHRNDEGEIVHIRASKVGDNNIKPDTWYMLDADGEFVEVKA